ncbi:IS66 family insertion sequence element accessory protein TnpA [Tautonia sociabilis]|uniref:Uncharacterized protein n=1 Tax=Tautonia sociabilis TaxID=2080755 RepID=A0A432MJQ2_9BACT|nr:hypothetical protein [Tautonia sociabilis]RUL87479.1 IS66 family insertion sequence hypothetical protein [Tautonia sociabilis]
MPRQASDHTPWLAAIAEFRHSGLTQAEFCRRRGLPLHTFRRYLYGRRGPAAAPAAPAPADTPRLVPVTLVADPVAAGTAAAADDPLVLILDGRLRIAVAPGFDPRTLRRLLDALGDRP